MQEMADVFARNNVDMFTETDLERSDVMTSTPTKRVHDGHVAASSCTTSTSSGEPYGNDIGSKTTCSSDRRESCSVSMCFNGSSSSALAQYREKCNDFKAPILGYEVMEQRARYTVFKINVQNINMGESWFVFRRYTDFVRLNKKLRQLFPNVHISLPQKRWFRDNFDTNFLEDRQIGLQTFVNNVLNMKLFCESPCVREFFCFDDPPGPADSFEESKVRCENLEELVNSLKLELQEKRAEVEILRAELSMATSQKETLSIALRNECEVANKVAAINSLSSSHRSMHFTNMALLKMTDNTQKRTNGISTMKKPEDLSSSGLGSPLNT